MYLNNLISKLKPFTKTYNYVAKRYIYLTYKR